MKKCWDVGGYDFSRPKIDQFFFFWNPHLLHAACMSRRDWTSIIAVPCHVTGFCFPLLSVSPVVMEQLVCVSRLRTISPFLSLDCTCLSALPSRIHVGRAAEAEPSYFLFLHYSNTLILSRSLSLSSRTLYENLAVSHG